MADRRHPEWDWLTLERRVARRILSWGLSSAVTAMVVGLAAKLVTGDLSAPAVTLTAIADASTLGDAVMAVGLGLLVATPAVNVLALGVVWGWQRDRSFAAAAMVVAVLLIAAALIGEGS